MKNNKNKKNIIFKLGLPLTIFLLVLLYWPIHILFQYIGREYEYIDDYYSIEEPIQTESEEETTLKIDEKELNVKLLYEYEINGYVTATFSYLPYTLDNKVSPRDITIVWGELIKKDNLEHAKFFESGDRSVYAYFDEYLMEKYDNLEQQFSHNHLIPSNKTIKKKIGKIRKGDYIRIKGYLAEVSYEKENISYSRGTSTTRDDSGGTACESIYVTEVTWLKEKKD
jgi:hypothetical protein